MQPAPTNIYTEGRQWVPHACRPSTHTIAHTSHGHDGSNTQRAMPAGVAAGDERLHGGVRNAVRPGLGLVRVGDLVPMRAKVRVG